MLSHQHAESVAVCDGHYRLPNCLQPCPQRGRSLGLLGVAAACLALHINKAGGSSITGHDCNCKSTSAAHMC